MILLLNNPFDLWRFHHFHCICKRISYPRHIMLICETDGNHNFRLNSKKANILIFLACPSVTTWGNSNKTLGRYIMAQGIREKNHEGNVMGEEESYVKRNIWQGVWSRWGKTELIHNRYDQTLAYHLLNCNIYLTISCVSRVSEHTTSVLTSDHQSLISHLLYFNIYLSTSHVYIVLCLSLTFHLLYCHIYIFVILPQPLYLKLTVGHYHFICYIVTFFSNIYRVWGHTFRFLLWKNDKLSFSGFDAQYLRLLLKSTKKIISVSELLFS